MMNELEKKIGQRLRDAESSGGVDANELWANIAGHLEEEPPKSAIFRWYLFLIPLLMIGVGVLLWQVKPQSTFAERQTGTSSKTSQSSTSTEPHDVNPSVDNVTFEPCVSEGSENEGTVAPVHAEPLRTDNNWQNPTEPLYANIKSDVTSNLRQRVDSLSKRVGLIEEEPALLQTGEVVTASPLILQPVNSADNSFFEVTRIDGVEIKPGIPDPVLIVQTSRKFSSLKKKRFELGLHAGSTLVLPDFTAEETEASQRTDLLNSGYQADPRLTVSLELNYRLTERFSISSGLQFNRLTEEFNYFNEGDTTITIIDGVDTLTRNAVFTRTVRHHNKHTALSVPLLLVYNRAQGRLNYGVGAGVSLNFIRSQSGKTINAAGRVATFDSTLGQSGLPRPTFNLAYLLQGRLGYRLNDHWSAALRANLSYADYGYREFYDLRLSTLNLGVNVGLNYRF